MRNPVFMEVPVFVNKMRFIIGQYLGGLALADDFAFRQNISIVIVSNVFDDVKIVRSRHNCPSAIAAGDLETDDFALTVRVEGGCWLVDE